VPALKPEDASYHRLKVTVDGEDGVAYRHGYFADAAAKGAGPPSELRLMRAAAEVNGPPMYDVRFKVRVVPAVDAASAAGAGAKLTRYKLDFAVPAGALAFSASAKGHRDTLEFVAVAFDAQGRRLNYIDQRSPVDVDDATYARILKSGILLHQQIDLPAGKVLLRVVVHDVDGNKAGALQVPLVVGGGG
jgi:hypothetical protein